MKRLQEETGAKMSILGKGSMRDKGKVWRNTSRMDVWRCTSHWCFTVTVTKTYLDGLSCLCFDTFSLQFLFVIYLKKMYSTLSITLIIWFVFVIDFIDASVLVFISFESYHPRYISEDPSTIIAAVYILKYGQLWLRVKGLCTQHGLFTVVSPVSRLCPHTICAGPVSALVTVGTSVTTGYLGSNCRDTGWIGSIQWGQPQDPPSRK